MNPGRARALVLDGPSVRSGRRAEAPRTGAVGISFLVLGVGALWSFLARDWLAGAGVLVLYGVWWLLWEQGKAPVLPLALSFQWLQITCGIYYFALTGREVEAMYASDYRPMVMLGLGCVGALALGLATGLKWGSHHFRETKGKNNLAFPWQTLFAVYVGATFVNAFLFELAWSVPGLTQGLLAIGYMRLALLFLIFRRVVHPRIRWEWLLGLLGVEIMLGFTGYFAGFREPMILAALAMLEFFQPRSFAQWMRIALLGAIMFGVGLVWIGIRTTFRSELDDQLSQSRAERLGRVGELSSEWLTGEVDSMTGDLDRLVERLWVVYYPALAVSRVPGLLPHEDGAIMLAAVTHLVTPRILFPEKGILPSDSEMVRKYSGIMVAGPEENTSIAFGYAAESYVDFGIPLMFLPSLIFGVVMGLVYRFLHFKIRHAEIAVGLAGVVFWISLYLFERSWIKTLGSTATLLIYLGGIVYFLDRRLGSSSILRPGGRKRARS